MKKSEGLILVEQDFQTSIEAVWSALTDIDEMKKWFFDNIPDFQPKVGFSTQFAVANESRTFTHRWTITEVIPQQSITYSWNYVEYIGDSFITFTLTEIKNGVRLNLTIEVVEDFPDDIPEFERASCIGGWDYFIGQQLRGYLEG